MTTASWMTKYGRRRVRHEPPTLEEALTAAEGLTNEPREQIEMAADLMQLPVETVRADAERIQRSRAGRVQIQVMQARGTMGSVLVERKPARRILRDMPAKGTLLRTVSRP